MAERVGFELTNSPLWALLCWCLVTTCLQNRIKEEVSRSLEGIWKGTGEPRREWAIRARRSRGLASSSTLNEQTFIAK